LEKTKKIASQANSLSGDEESVSKLLYSLPRVEATKDFEFRVKARVAQRCTAPGKPGYIRALAYVLPVFLALIVASIFFLRQPGSREEISQVQPSVAAPAEQRAADPVVAEPPVIAESKPDVPAVPAASRTTTVASTRPPTETVLNDDRPRRIRGRSYDSALSPATTILPRGMKANPGVQSITNPDAPNQKPTVGDVLRTYGVSAIHGAGGWTVSGVSGNASKAGVHKGDVIESEQTDANGAHLTVKRGGSKLQISLKP